MCVRILSELIRRITICVSTDYPMTKIPNETALFSKLLLNIILKIYTRLSTNS